MEHEKIAYEKANGIGTVVYVAKGGKFLGYILVADIPSLTFPLGQRLRR